MRFDNFNTARCSKCGVVKQYQPGVDYQPKEFECDCKAEQPKKKATPKRKQPQKESNPKSSFIKDLLK